jgi:MinD-like ATPase involved in chromosome partitioning or flagellar assembly
VDLPTYTSIWRIEKRLYKLYDFRLPMPLPIGQITVFAVIAVPYVVLLTLLGLPLSHSLIWLYVLPPGVATWLVTRPVLESKRLPELIRSQLRYLAEPRVWCRMAPLAESNVVVVTGRVWRLPPAVLAQASNHAGRKRSGQALSARARSVQARSVQARPAPALSARSRSVQARSVQARSIRVRSAQAQAAQAQAAQAQAAQARPQGSLGVGQAPALVVPPLDRSYRPQSPESPGRPHRSPTAPPTRPAAPLPAGQILAEPAKASAADSSVAAPSVAVPSVAVPSVTEPPVAQSPVAQPPAAAETAEPGPAPASAAGTVSAAAGTGSAGQRPVVTVVNTGQAQEAPLPVERALAGPSARRHDSRAGRVTVVPGGHRPGKPDQLQRDRARAQLPIDGKRRVVVLGCTVGAGQTITTLLTGEVLASLRPDSVAVLDLNPGAESLAQRARQRPALGQAASLGPSRLVVLGSDVADEVGAAERPVDSAGAAKAFERAGAAHQIVLADPSTATVPRLLAIADQLVLVAPASAAAARSIGMTFEWLDAHGQAGLASSAIMIMNGVSRRSTPQVEQAERVCIGRCRAIVRVPWDDQLKIQPGAGQYGLGQPGAGQQGQGQQGQAQQGQAQQWTGLLSSGTISAYTALAGVLVAALAGPDPDRCDDQANDAAADPKRAAR